MKTERYFDYLFFWILITAALCALAPTARAAEVLDERVTLTPSGACRSSADKISFAGQPATLEGTSVKNSGGAVLYAGSETILDAASAGGVDYILSAASFTVRMGKKSNSLPLLGDGYTRGKILFASPTFLIYYLTRGEETVFVTQTSASRRIIFAAGKDFVSARLDKFGNTVIALNDGFVVLDKSGGRVAPVLQLPDDNIANFEIDPSDNGILFATPRGLFKFAANRKLYTIVAGAGKIEQSGSSQFFWCDGKTAERFEMNGLASVGDLASDKTYVRLLLAQADKLMLLDLQEKAFQKYLKILEIMPNEPSVKKIVLNLGDKLYGTTAIKN